MYLMTIKPFSHYSIIDYESLIQTFPEKYHYGNDGVGKRIIPGGA
jgi:hypothetical protein